MSIKQKFKQLGSGIADFYGAARDKVVSTKDTIQEAQQIEDDLYDAIQGENPDISPEIAVQNTTAALKLAANKLDALDLIDQILGGKLYSTDRGMMKKFRKLKKLIQEM